MLRALCHGPIHYLRYWPNPFTPRPWPLHSVQIGHDNLMAMGQTVINVWATPYVTGPWPYRYLQMGLLINAACIMSWANTLFTVLAKPIHSEAMAITLSTDRPRQFDGDGPDRNKRVGYTICNGTVAISVST